MRECIHHLFEQQAARTPDLVAVEWGDERLTYAALDARANQLALGLRAHGVGPEQRVALFSGRTPELIVGLLAILKAGGAYAPIDPAFPLARRAWLLGDCAPALVLADGASLANAQQACAVAGAHAPVVEVGRCGVTGRAALAHHGAGAHLAYVLYTSGSTGQPKGVMVEHRNVVNILADMAIRLELKPGAAVPAITPISFDIAGLEIFLPLSVGQRIVLAARETTRDPYALSRFLNRDDLSFVQATPSTWRGLFQVGWRSRGAAMLCGGEAMTSGLARCFLDQGAPAWNVYGPTETTIWSSAALLCEGAPVTLGRPIANTDIYVIDEKLAPVSAGEEGEICIAGAGVARGYLHRPALTAACFIHDPFAGCSRLYRTGDRGRLRADGEIEFLGRMDRQVKIRGARVELAEIEAALAEDRDIVQAAVIAGADAAGNDCILAYVVLARGAAADERLIRKRLAERLPEYMLPDRCMVLEELPLTSNGKLDRTALNAPAVAIASDDATESVIAAAFAEMLGERAIGKYESFFDLGGNSMLLLALAARVQDRLKIEIDLQAAFSEPTIAGLTAQARRRMRPEPQA